MADTPTIQASRRERVGSRYAQRLRRSGRLPAIIYGHKIDPLIVSIDGDELLGLVRHGTHVINVAVEGGQSQTCLIKDLQYGHLGDNLLHVDLARVNLDEVVEVQVHLHFVGDLVAARRPGAILSHDLTELELRCRVADIPSEIRIELGKLPEQTEMVTVGQIALPPGVETTLDPATPVVHVTFVHAEEVGEAAAVAAPTEPEVITERKEEEPAE
jgi:large subunit ribosomal protein L25